MSPREGAPPPGPVPITVVINTLNRRDHLKRTLIALRQQTYPAFEVVVVDGPSTDGTAEMLTAFADRARLATCTEASLGLSRNIGVKLAAGDIVAFTDDDAVPRADWLELLAAPFSDERVAAVGGPVFDVPLNRVEWRLCTCTRLGVPDTNSTGGIDRYLGPGSDPFAYLAGCNMSFRRSCLREIGGFNSLLSVNYDDVEVCCRLIDRGHRLAYVNDALVRHERAPNAVRDAQQTIRDPYPILYSRAVFSLQCEYSSHDFEGIADSIRAAVRDWHDAAAHRLAANELTHEEYRTFVDRASGGAEAGITAGTGARPRTQLPAPPRDLFRPYW
jgi:cellulose synthase/poly-beta-1,6-N-acetylglucosamine synthase-like glycosyltransferase